MIFRKNTNYKCPGSGNSPLPIIIKFQLVKQVVDGESEVEIQYSRAVKYEGNKKALEVLNTVFTEDDAEWRGIGKIEKSGLAVREEFSGFDTDSIFSFQQVEIPSTSPFLKGSSHVFRSSQGANQSYPLAFGIRNSLFGIRYSLGGSATNGVRNEGHSC